MAGVAELYPLIHRSTKVFFMYTSVFHLALMFQFAFVFYCPPEEVFIYYCRNAQADQYQYGEAEYADMIMDIGIIHHFDYSDHYAQKIHFHHCPLLQC